MAVLGKCQLKSLKKLENRRQIKPTRKENVHMAHGMSSAPF